MARSKGLEVRRVQALGATQALMVRFSDGRKGRAELDTYLRQKKFAELREPRVFQTVVVDRGGVAWPGTGLRLTATALYALVHGISSRATREILRGEEPLATLAELRRVAELTQEEAAYLAELTQGALSQFERAKDHKVSALRRYVEVLGGTLEIAVVVDGKRFRLDGV